MRRLILPLSFTLLSCSSYALQAAQLEAPKLQLAKVYEQTTDLTEFYVSEKLDGIRAYWNGNQLVTRLGNQINAPAWFTSNLPDTALDGELWIARGEFEQVSSVVRKYEPIDSEWRRVKFMVFDLPASLKPFDERYEDLKAMTHKIGERHVELVQQFEINNKAQLDHALKCLDAIGGEGLMLHRKKSFYQARRSQDLQKVKSYQDEEARVVAYIPGKGQFDGLMGSLLVERADGLRFKIGTGFSLKERQQPPQIGSQITYRFRGTTKKGVPRFASFMREREAF